MINVRSSRLRFLSLVSHLFIRNQAGKTMTGEALALRDFLFGYGLKLDSVNKRIEVTKRNWFVSGVDSKTFNYGQVRNVLVNEHLITASVVIRVYAGNIEVHWLRKLEAQRFRHALIADSAPSDGGVFLE